MACSWLLAIARPRPCHDTNDIATGLCDAAFPFQGAGGWAEDGCAGSCDEFLSLFLVNNGMRA